MIDKPFKELSYRSQVQALKQLALETCIDQYPIKVAKIDFIQHGENTTFKVTDTKGNNYLLRVHRNGYHTQSAIKEELMWLKRIRKNTNIVAPMPISTKTGKLIAHGHIKCSSELRSVTVFEWVVGRKIRKSVNLNHMTQIAELTHKLHKHTENYSVKHRHYWGANGLVGKKPFIGSMDHIHGISQNEQALLNQARKAIYSKLLRYEKKNPQKMGLIHADLHFGNFFNRGGDISPIDFDDCGQGFHMYDLAVTITSISHGIDQKIISKREYQLLSDKFLKEYDKYASLSQSDLNTIETLKLARRLIGTQWFNLRSDNPILAAKSIPYAKETVRILKKEFKSQI